MCDKVGETDKLSPMHFALRAIGHVEDKASECKLGLLQGADFAKSTSGAYLVINGMKS